MYDDNTGGTTRLLVRPDTPTILNGETVVKLPGYELWMHYVRSPMLISHVADISTK